MKSYFLYISILTSLVLFAWHKIFFHTILGEGYVYFARNMKYPIWGEDGSIINIFRYDNFARLLYSIFEKLFSENLTPYMIFLIFTLILMSVSYYFMINVLTKNKIIAFFASIFFAINYIGLSDMIGSGYYQWFTQRVPNFILSFISFTFYIKFLDSKNNYKYYLISILFFTLSILAAHFSLFFLPVFIIYGLLSLIIKFKLKAKFFIGAAMLAPYLLVSYFFIAFAPVLPPDKPMLEVIRDTDFIKELFYQVSAVTIPMPIWSIYSLIFPGLSVVNIIQNMYFPILIFYILTIIVSFKIKQRFGVILLTCFLSIVAASVLNLYMNKGQASFKQYETNRYFLSLSFFISIYWSIICYYFFSRKMIIAKLIVITFIVFSAVQNIQVIWHKDREKEYPHLVNKKTQEYVKNNTGKFKENSIIILPKEVGPHAADFYQKYYGKKKTLFISITGINKDIVLNFNSNKDYLISYDFKNNIAFNNTLNYQKVFKKIGY